MTSYVESLFGALERYKSHPKFNNIPDSIMEYVPRLPVADGMLLLIACNYFEEVLNYLLEKTMSTSGVVLLCYPKQQMAYFCVTDVDMNFARKVVLPWALDWRGKYIKEEYEIPFVSPYKNEMGISGFLLGIPLAAKELADLQRFRKIREETKLP